MEIKVYKIRKNAKLPQKYHKEDAGFDLFYCPLDESKENAFCIKHPQELIVYPRESAIIPTGIKLGFESNIMVEIKNKGGIATKRQLLVGACVIDSKFDSEIFVNLHNVGYEKQIFFPGDKIAQMVPIKIENNIILVENENDDINEGGTRGEGCLGSTGNS